MNVWRFLKPGLQVRPMHCLVVENLLHSTLNLIPMQPHLSLSIKQNPAVLRLGIFQDWRCLIYTYIYICLIPFNLPFDSPLLGPPIPKTHTLNFNQGQQIADLEKQGKELYASRGLCTIWDMVVDQTWGPFQEVVPARTDYIF